jgi:hypothetical protein
LGPLVGGARESSSRRVGGPDGATFFFSRCANGLLGGNPARAMPWLLSAPLVAPNRGLRRALHLPLFPLAGALQLPAVSFPSSSPSFSSASFFLSVRRGGFYAFPCVLTANYLFSLPSSLVDAYFC